MGATRHDAVVQGIRTSWLEAGRGPVLLLLHGGAWGECAETAWGPVIERYARTHRVLAPDWLGFGHTSKLRDFEDLQGRMTQVLADWLAAAGVSACAAVGLSMGGANLLRDLTAPSPRLPLTAVVLLSAGGHPLRPEVRALLADYDGTTESMRRQVHLSCADPTLAADDAVVEARRAASLLPGAFEVMASLGLRSPVATPPPALDPTPYESVRQPVLVIAGARDALKPSGWAADMMARLPHGSYLELPAAGHCVQLDEPDRVAAAVLAFVAGSGAGSFSQEVTA